ncbi:hypothetical protein [Agathobaculum sp.]|uniref:hypothetical protein n=1 Tax=Agathobaculum sp. TaxID=2048138 RepID=UPI002A830318|nr:hypothetical protein [Agathobaculum sp.]MDY3618448.1 hypothetical protein [Agathobaculum sp.]
MDEQNKQPAEEQHSEKKLSRKTLTFYIIGLFSVAIALILVSYVTQARTDKQLENLSTKLSEQQNVAQGATQKMEEIQKQLDGMSKALEGVREAIGTEEAETDVVSAARHLVEERDVYAAFANINLLQAEGDLSAAHRAYTALVGQYGEDRLSGTAKEDAFGAEINKLFTEAKERLQSEGPGVSAANHD